MFLCRFIASPKAPHRVRAGTPDELRGVSSSLRAAHSLIFRATRPGLLLRASCAAVEESLGPRQWWAFSPSFGVRLPQLLRHLFAVLLDLIRRTVLRDTAPGTAAGAGTTTRAGTVAVGLSLPSSPLWPPCPASGKSAWRPRPRGRPLRQE